MQIKIDDIIVDEAARIRREAGSLDSLQLSIEKVGLINPIVIDENRNLVAGFRRYTACRNLGWEEVEVRVVECGGDAIRLLEVEVAENWYRKDFTPEETLAAEKKRQEIIESRRKKGFFERLWLWLKSLFQPAKDEPPNVPGDVPESKTATVKQNPSGVEKIS